MRAHADGGYLIFGVSDENGYASDIPGIEVPDDDTDKFELARRNNLSAISPRTPYLKFHFVKLTNARYVLVIYVKNDSFTPYSHIVDEKNYRFCKRYGNGKQTIPYAELKIMFNQSASLDKEIREYRQERVNYYKSFEDDAKNTYSKFLMLHIIPETFMDSRYNETMLILENSGRYKFSGILSDFGCSSPSIPCVDGLRYIESSRVGVASECFIYNNKIVECFFPLSHAIDTNSTRYPNGLLAWRYVWDKICGTVNTYIDQFATLLKNQRVYVCISIIGCKGVSTTSESENCFTFASSTIDRNMVFCNPVSIDDMDSGKAQENMKKRLYIEYMLSIGKKHEEYLKKFIQEVYHS